MIGGDDDVVVRLRLIWNICRDEYDKAIMLSYWGGEKPQKRKDLVYQDALMKKCNLLVTKYLKEAPTWADVIIK